MWDFIINPMVTALVVLYQVLGNSTVLSIVVLTVILRLIMYPILAGQQESAQKMQAIQPKLKDIQEKYKDDPEKLRTAQMELYSTEGINPFGGCLPLLLQLPVFIALYSAINFAVAATPFELVDLADRLLLPGLDGLIPLQNTFLGMNLAAPPTPPSNPIYAYALPVLVALTTYIQFKMSSGARPKQEEGEKASSQPDQAAAMQQSMGTMMPIMYGFISLSLSVGLSIYFLIGNLIGIAQYTTVGKRFLDTIFFRNRKTEEVVEEKAIVKSSKKSVGKTN
jgi:YidC/Oxa1 family membrane protein insertase